MRHALICACTAVAALSSMARAPAQITVPDALAAPGPLQHEYFNGAGATDPAVERRLPMEPRYRSYLPVSVDLSSTMPAVGDQGRSQSCSAWSTAYAARSYYTRALEGRRIDTPANLPSPSYVFHLARQGDWGCAEGTNIPRVVEVLRHGALSLADYPFSPACRAPASQAQIARANDFRVQSFTRVDVTNIEDLKGQLSRHNPVIIRFNDTVAFQKHRGPSTFTELLRDPNAVTVGWHSFTLVGYDERRQAFKLINSWGTKWGDNGYGWISYEALGSRSSNAYVLDLGALRPVASNEPPVRPAADGPSEIKRSIIKPGVVSTHEPAASARLSDLDDLACARVTAEKIGDRHVVSGFVASAEDLDRVKSIAASVPDTALGDIAVAPWPRCELLLTLAKPLAAADRPKVTLAPVIEISPPARPSYLYVSVLEPDGSVTHLLQPDAASPRATPAGGTVPLGDARKNDAKGVIVALASPVPLFDKPLAPTQTEREYLSALRRALIHKPTPDAPDRDVTAAIETMESR